AGNGGPTRLAMPDLPSPEQAKSLTVPCNHRLGLDHVQRRTPVAPNPGDENPKQAVGGSQLRPSPGRPLKDPDLVPEGQVLQLQRSSGAQHRTQRGKKRGQQDEHRVNAIFSNRTEFPIGTVYGSAGPENGATKS